MFDTMTVLLNEYFEKVHLEKNPQTTKEHENLGLQFIHYLGCLLNRKQISINFLHAG